MMDPNRRLEKLQMMTADELRGELTALLADEKRLAELSAEELQFFEGKSAEWRAEAARLDADVAARLAAWNPPIGASGKVYVQ
jgi:hypothetical protein